MKHFKKLLDESRHLTVFEMLSKLQTFLHEKYGIKSFGSKKDNHFIMHISTYVDEEKQTKDLSAEIQKFVASETELENVTVEKTQKGYVITFGHDAQKAKLIEVTQAQGTGMSDSKITYKCHFCDKEFEGYGNDPWPIANVLEHRACDNCNTNFVIPARIEQFEKQKSKTEATQSEIEQSASNIILDDKFTWLFNVMDERGRDIEEGIEFLADAIDVLINKEGAFLIAFPYVDPKPEDPNVDFVFADNPGPVIIYNNEKVTVPKDVLKRPTTEEQPKPQEEEEVIEESTEDPIEESAEDFFHTTVNMLPEWYREMDKYEVEAFELFESLIVTLEEFLEDNDIFTDFIYAGQPNYDLMTYELSFDEATQVQKLLQEFLGSWAYVNVKRKDF